MSKWEDTVMSWDSVKGVKTYSCTVEMVDVEQAVVLAESDSLVKALDTRYTIQLDSSV